MGPRFSFYKATHRRALKNLVDWVLSLNFLPTLTLLVKVRELASVDLFLEVLTLSILGRPECGLVMPDREAVDPEHFYKQIVDEDSNSEVDLGNNDSNGNGTDGHKRQKRQALVNWTWRLSNTDP